MNQPQPVMCKRGHGPKGPGWRCATCDRERQRAKATARRQQNGDATECRNGHPYREGSFRVFTRTMPDGHTATVRTCLVCLEQARKVSAAKRRSGATPTPPPAPAPPRHLKKFDKPTRAPRGPRTYPGKLNTTRRDMQERVNAIHLEILHAIDGMDIRSRAEQAAWKIREAELTREADQLTAKLDAQRIAAGTRKRIAQ